jgi:hypothetical protein
VLPRSSRTYVGLNCYVPWGSAEALRRAISYRGDTRVGATNHEVTPEIICSFKVFDCLLGFRKAHHSLLPRGKLTGIKCLLQAFRPSPLPASLHGVLAVRLSHPSTPLARVPGAPRRPWSVKVTTLQAGRAGRQPTPPRPRVVACNLSPPREGAWIANRTFPNRSGA